MPRDYRRGPTVKQRMFAKVEIRPASDCWHWTGSTNDGYGNGTKLHGRNQRAHVVMWIIYRGPVPDGMSLDHLCRNRACCNPEHLEPVTLAENTRRELAAVGHPNSRKTHCRNGHPYSEDNTHTDRDGRRECRICRREITRRSWAKRGKQVEAARREQREVARHAH